MLVQDMLTGRLHEVPGFEDVAEPEYGDAYGYTEAPELGFYGDSGYGWYGFNEADPGFAYGEVVYDGLGNPVGLFPAIAAALPAIMGVAKTAIPALIGAAKTALPAISQAVRTVAPVVGQAVRTALPVLQQAVGQAAPAFRAIGQAIPQVAQAVTAPGAWTPMPFPGMPPAPPLPMPYGGGIRPPFPMFPPMPMTGFPGAAGFPSPYPGGMSYGRPMRRFRRR